MASKIKFGAKIAQYIALRYTCPMAKAITSADYQALAELRYVIRKFVGEGDAAAHAAGLEPQQLSTAARDSWSSRRRRRHDPGSGGPSGTEASQHGGTHRPLELHDYVRRSRSRDDRRRVLVTLLPRGEKLLEQVARHRISELRSSGAALVKAISALLGKGHSLRARLKS